MSAEQRNTSGSWQSQTWLSSFDSNMAVFFFKIEIQLSDKKEYQFSLKDKKPSKLGIEI